jgi:single-strand DNA-binding protein
MQQGWIKSLVGGAIPNGTTVHVDFTAETTQGTEIRGMTQAQLRARFKLVGKISEIEFAGGGRGASQQSGTDYPSTPAPQRPAPTNKPKPSFDDLGDDIPF